MNKEIKEKINLLLNSDAINYLETSERLTLKNGLETEIISELMSKKLYEIFQKYGKFIKKLDCDDFFPDFSSCFF